MEPPSNPDNDSDSHKSEENNTQPESEQPSEATEPQTSEVTEKEESQINSKTESNVEEKNDASSSSGGGGGSVVVKCDTKTEEQNITDEPTKEIDNDLTKCPEEFASTIEKLSGIMAYPFKKKPRQPFRNMPEPPPTAPTSGHAPPVVPRPPEPPQRPLPLRRMEPTNDTAGSSAANPPAGPPPVTEQPRLGSMGPRAPGIGFVDTCPLYPMSPACFIPNSMFSTVVWAPLPSKIPGQTPGGLTHLISADNIYVTQINFFDYFGQTSDFFVVQNKNGECLYFVYESTDYGEFSLCDNCRAYRLHVMDMFHSEAFVMNKLSGCNSCCCCYPEMQVFIPPGVPVGVITKKCHWSHELYSIRDPEYNEMFKMVGSDCPGFFCCCVGSNYTIHALDPNRTEVGLIQRDLGFATTFFNSELFGLTVPIDMDVKIKALFLGALFLIVY